MAIAVEVVNSILNIERTNPIPITTEQAIEKLLPTLQIPEKLRKQFRDVLWRFYPAFKEKIGCLKTYVHKLDIDATIPNMNPKERRLPLSWVPVLFLMAAR